MGMLTYDNLISMLNNAKTKPIYTYCRSWKFRRCARSNEVIWLQVAVKKSTPLNFSLRASNTKWNTKWYSASEGLIEQLKS